VETAMKLHASSLVKTIAPTVLVLQTEPKLVSLVQLAARQLSLRTLATTHLVLLASSTIELSRTVMLALPGAMLVIQLLTACNALLVISFKEKLLTRRMLTGVHLPVHQKDSSPMLPLVLVMLVQSAATSVQPLTLAHNVTSSQYLMKLMVNATATSHMKQESLKTILLSLILTTFNGTQSLSTRLHLALLFSTTKLLQPLIRKS
jgi:hypothetical protein